MTKELLFHMACAACFVWGWVLFTVWLPWLVRCMYLMR